MEPTNNQRASWAYTALAAFARQTRQDATGSDELDHSPRVVICDLLTDLCHLCDQLHLHFFDLVQDAANTHDEEVQEEAREEELCADALADMEELHADARADRKESDRTQRLFKKYLCLVSRHGLSAAPVQRFLTKHQDNIELRMRANMHQAGALSTRTTSTGR
jgi:hypothetical protein